MFRKNTSETLRRLPQATPKPLERIFNLQQNPNANPVKTGILKIWNILTPDEIKSGTLLGVPLNLVRQALEEQQIEERRQQALAPRKKVQHKERVRGLKHMLLSERAARGEERGKPEDIEYIQGIRSVLEQAKTTEELLLNNTSPTIREDNFQGEVLPLLQRMHDRLPSAIRLNFANVGSEKPQEQLQKRLAKVLEVSARVHESSLRINEYRSKGKPLGIGMPGLGDSAVVTHRGIRLFASGATKAQLADHDLPDMSVDWRDIAEGHVRVSLAPSGLDAVRNLWKRLRGRTDDLPATVLFTEGQHGRSFRVTMSGGRQFVEQIKLDARNLAQADFVPDEIDSLRKDFGPENVDGLLKRLDNS